MRVFVFVAAAASVARGVTGVLVPMPAAASAAGLIAGFVLMLVVIGVGVGFCNEEHAAFGTLSRLGALHFGVHRAGVDGFARGLGRLTFVSEYHVIVSYRLHWIWG